MVQQKGTCHAQEISVQIWVKITQVFFDKYDLYFPLKKNENDANKVKDSPLKNLDENDDAKELKDFSQGPLPQVLIVLNASI